MTSIPGIENSVRRTLEDFPFRKRLLMRLGSAGLPCFSRRAAHLKSHPFPDGETFLDRLLRNGLLRQAFLSRDFSQLRHFLARYWEKNGAIFHDAWQDRFERLFLAHDQIAIEALESHLRDNPSAFTPQNLYEIGCGGGEVLNHLGERFPSLHQVVGIDLSEEQILRNRDHFSGKPLIFHAADAVEWIPRHALPGSVFLTNGGVFEYFLKEEIESILAHISQQLRPAAVVIIETIGVDHDLSTEPDSQVYGREMAFSHHYPHLLEKHGFQIRHRSERVGEEIDGGGRWLRLLGVAE